MKASKFSISRAVIYIVLAAVALIQIFPLYWLVTFSLKNNVEILGDNPLGLPHVWAFENYATAMSRGNIGMFFINSVIVSAAAIAISTALAAMAAYAIARMNWKLSNKTLLVFLSGLMISSHATLVPLFIILRRANLYDTYWALILPYAAFAIPFAVYIFVGFFKTLPRELEEAACLDGMNIYQVFFNIMLPLIRPAIATVSIFTYLSCWNELMYAISFIGGEEHKTLTAGIMGLVGRYATNWGALGAGLMIATLPTLIIYLLMSGQIQKSFSAGALKG